MVRMAEVTPSCVKDCCSAEHLHHRRSQGT